MAQRRAIALLGYGWNLKTRKLLGSYSLLSTILFATFRQSNWSIAGLSSAHIVLTSKINELLFVSLAIGCWLSIMFTWSSSSEFKLSASCSFALSRVTWFLSLRYVRQYALSTWRFSIYSTSFRTANSWICNRCRWRWLLVAFGVGCLWSYCRSHIFRGLEYIAWTFLHLWLRWCLVACGITFAVESDSVLHLLQLYFLGCKWVEWVVTYTQRKWVL